MTARETFDVLVVDDDFMVAEIHRRFVAKVDGFAVVAVARNGAEALAAIASEQPDLVLLDVYLPDMSGLDVLRRLRADGNPVGVIMITAAREIDTVRGALHGGAADYLIKPFEFVQLQDKLRAFAARARALGSDSGADQSLIDSLFGNTGTPAGTTVASSVDHSKSQLPKGLSAETGKLVLETLRTGGELSSSECADLVGLSRVSARRYLEYYLTTGAVEIRLQYGRAGRPERRYRVPRN